jgi:hypothetical protein
MPNIYSNLPLKSTENQNSTVLAFDNYYEKPLELDGNTFEAMKSFFTSRGFETSAAESVVVVIIKQAKKDGYNPMEILDTLKGLNNVEISALVSEIVNNNRIKTSFLGYGLAFEPNFEVARNIINNKVKRSPPTYIITKSREIVDEGQQITFLITTENVKDNTIFYWTLSGTGITSGDITGGQLSGTTIISNSTASVTVTLALDSLTEGNEILVFELRKRFVSGPVVASSNVTVNDISFSTLADYMVIEYTFTTGLDLDSKTRLAVPSVAASNGKLYVGWRQATGVPNADFEFPNPNILSWGGDNIGVGRESAVFDFNEFKRLYPTTNNIVIDCRALWYREVSPDPVGLKITLYQGGTIQKTSDEYGFENPTATSSIVLDLTLKYITLFTTDPESVGDRIATVKYNLLTGVGSVDSTDDTIYPHP